MCTSTNVNNIVYPCKICHVNVNYKDPAAQSDVCQPWVYIKCNKFNHIAYKYNQIYCGSKIFPFGTPTNKDFIPSITNSLTIRYQE